MELDRRRDDGDEGEFYTAVGSDGKEIILKRYYGDVSVQNGSEVEDRGFLKMAMEHLRQKRQRREEAGGVDSTSDEEDSEANLDSNQDQDGLKRPTKRKTRNVASFGANVSALAQMKGIQKKSKYNSGSNTTPTKTTSSVATMAPSVTPPDAQPDDDEDYDLTPKHHIRSPIIEETESSVEAELMRSRANADGIER